MTITVTCRTGHAFDVEADANGTHYVPGCPHCPEDKELPLSFNEPRSEVKWFARRMEERLRQNDHKTGWIGFDWEILLERILTELEELAEVVQLRGVKGADWEQRVIEKAADVANFSMFCADNARRRDRKEASS